jgi:tetratricopeptide (TPR) repeat protein
MKKKFELYFILIMLAFTFNSLLAAQSDYFSKGKILFDKKDFKKSKLFFEKDIVFNPKSENSYLYLAKIFKKNDNEDEEEKNLDTVLLLNPKNDEAIYLLTLLKIKQSDYEGAKDLIKKFELICSTYCNKKNEMKKKFDKLIPKNEKN